MRCSKCLKDFEEKNIHGSHDIPKWLGGKDSDGRHWLCKDCHDKYELEVIRLVMMNFIKDLPDKEKYQWCAKLVKSYFFKRG